MDGHVTSSVLPAAEAVQHARPGGDASLALAGAEAITLLLRDGSRLRLLLADPMRQAPELAGALAPPGLRPDAVTLELIDGSRLMLATSDILGLHLPPEHPAPSPPAQPPAAFSPPQTQGDTTTHKLGQEHILQIRNFLPESSVAALYRYALAKQPEFRTSSVLSNDPEYRKSVVLYRFPEYQTLFENMLRGALPQVSDALRVPRFELATFECQLTATFDKGYFKPHNDNDGALSHRHITYVYYFHREPKPFTGGEIRFFDHNPFAPQVPATRQMLDLAPVHNSIILFRSGTFHEVRDTICATASFENSRFTVNGWLGSQKKA